MRTLKLLTLTLALILVGTVNAQSQNRSLPAEKSDWFSEAIYGGTEVWRKVTALPLDMDVYDLAEWCCLIPLTEISLDNNSASVEIPDFTCGAWNKLDGLKFAQ